MGNDVDVLVKNVGEWCWKCVNKYDAHVDINREDRSAEVYIEKCVKIHLHERMVWCGKEFFDHGLPWIRPRRVRHLGVQVQVPNYDADFLMHIAHINYEPMVINYSEYKYLKHIFNRVRLRQCTRQAMKYHWARTFIRTALLLYDLPDDVTKFPVKLSRRHIAYAGIERGVWKYALKRLPKTLSVLIRNNVLDYVEVRG